MWINKLLNSSYNFLAPSIDADADKKVEVVFPTSEAQVVAAAATIPIEVVRTNTVIDLGTLAADATVNATIGDDVPVGAILVVKAKSDGTARAVTFGTGIDGAALAGTISKTKTAMFVFDGTIFIGISQQQID